MLCYVTLCKLSYYPHKIEDEMSRVCGMPEGEEHAYRVLVGKPLGKPRCKMNDNIKN
jgi:hypothetical protein